MSSPVGYPQRNAYPMFSSTSQGDVPVGKNGTNLIPVMANVTSSSGGLASQVGSSSYVIKSEPDIANLPTPWIIPHRGAGALIAPDAQLESYDLGLLQGFGVIDGGDWWLSSDGQLINCHNSTVDELTDQTGAVSSYTLAQLRAMTLDCSVYFGGNYLNKTGFHTAQEFFGRFGGRVCIAPEPESLQAAKQLAAYLRSIDLRKSILVNSFTQSFLDEFVKLGFPYVMLNLTSGSVGSGLTDAQCIAWRNAGITHVNLPYTVATSNGVTAKNNGLKVCIGTLPPTRQVQRLKWEGIADGYAADDPVYFSGQVDKYRIKSDPYGSKVYYHGHQNLLGAIDPAERGTFTSDGYLTWASRQTKRWFLMGWACPIENAASSYSINLSLRFDTLPSNTALGFSFFFCMPSDDAFNDSFAAFEKGYMLSFSAGGLLSMKKRNPTDGTAVSRSTAAVTAGQVVTLRIDVTPNDITVTRTDVASPNSIVRTDGEHRGGYFFYGSPAASSGDTMAVHSLKATITP